MNSVVASDGCAALDSMHPSMVIIPIVPMIYQNVLTFLCFNWISKQMQTQKLWVVNQSSWRYVNSLSKKRGTKLSQISIFAGVI